MKEVIALSKLENDKKTGKLNLDFLKRGNKNSPRGPNETPGASKPSTLDAKMPASSSLIIPPASTT